MSYMTLTYVYCVDLSYVYYMGARLHDHNNLAFHIVFLGRITVYLSSNILLQVLVKMAWYIVSIYRYSMLSHHFVCTILYRALM